MTNTTKKRSGSILKHFLTALGAILIYFGKLFGVTFPFAASACAVIPLKYAPGFLLTSSICMIIFGSDAFSYGAVISAFLVYGLRLYTSKSKKSVSPLKLALFSGISYLAVTLAAFLLILRHDAAEIPKILVFSALSTYLTYCLKAKTSKDYSFDIHSMTAYVAGISVLSSLGAFGFNLGRAFAVFILLHVAKSNDCKKTALLSVLSAFGCFITGEQMFVGSAFICIAGTLMSFVSSRSFIRQPLYLICGTLIFAMLGNTLSNDFGLVIDVFAASAIYIFTFDIASPFIDRLLLRFISESREGNTLYTDSILRADAIKRIEQQMAEVVTDHDMPKAPQNSVTAYSRVCMNCRRHRLCYSDGTTDLSFLDRQWNEDYIKSNLKNCIRIPDITRSINDIHTKIEYITSRRQTVKRETALVDSVLRGAELILDDHSSSKKLDIELTDAMNHRISHISNAVVNCRVYRDLSCEIDIKNGIAVNINAFVFSLSELTGIKYTEPQAVKSSDFTRYSINPHPNFFTETYLNQHPSKAGEPSGDVFIDFTSGHFHYFLLCDGMGTGQPAYNAAFKLTSYIKDLIVAGVSLDAALSIAAPVIRASGIDECFATLDLIRLDLVNGNIQFCKAGAAESYVLGSEFQTIPSGGYPIGIFDRCYTALTSADLSEGGEIIICSDGADLTHAKIQRAMSLSKSSDELADLLLDASVFSSPNAYSDDAFAAVIRVNKSKCRLAE